MAICGRQTRKERPWLLSLFCPPVISHQCLPLAAPGWNPGSRGPGKHIKISPCDTYRVEQDFRKDLKANRQMTNVFIKFNCKDNGVKFKLMSQKGKENWVSLRKKIKLREKFPKK